jgi:hypothetical protein
MTHPTFTREDWRAVDRALGVAATIYDSDATSLFEAGRPKEAQECLRDAERARHLASRIHKEIIGDG